MCSVMVRVLGHQYKSGFTVPPGSEVSQDIAMFRHDFET